MVLYSVYNYRNTKTRDCDGKWLASSLQNYDTGFDSLRSLTLSWRNGRTRPPQERESLDGVEVRLLLGGLETMENIIFGVGSTIIVAGLYLTIFLIILYDEWKGDLR